MVSRISAMDISYSGQRRPPGVSCAIRRWRLDIAVGGRDIDRMQFTVTVAHDEEDGIWYVVSSDIPGMHVEAPSLHLLVDVVDEVAPDLIAANLAACSL